MDKIEQNSYTISQISKMLDIPIDSIRYFEKEGVIQPQINKKNNYRYFGPWDISVLLEYKDYRSMEFSMTDVIDIQRNDDLTALVEKMDIQHQLMQEKKIHYSLMEDRLAEKKQSLERIPKYLNQIYRRKIEETEYIVCRDELAYQERNESGALLKCWRNYFPFLDYMMCFSNVEGEDNKITYIAGYSVAKRWMDLLKMPSSQGTSKLSSGEAVCTIVCSKGKGALQKEHMKPILDYLKENGIAFSGEIYGNLLARTNEKDGYYKFVELFIPIQ